MSYMKRKIKEEILNKAIELFIKNGYQNTTMRQIANSLNVAVGNINYYYPKKENIVIDYHNIVLDAFLNEVLTNHISDNPWIHYFAIEYGFMHFIATDEGTNTVYTSFTHEQSLRDFYINKHQELFLSIFYDVLPSNEEEIYLSTVAMCSLEFELISKYPKYSKSWELEDLLYHIFETRLSFLHINPVSYKEIIQEGIKKGKSLEPLQESIKKIISS